MSASESINPGFEGVLAVIYALETISPTLSGDIALTYLSTLEDFRAWREELLNDYQSEQWDVPAGESAYSTEGSEEPETFIVDMLDRLTSSWVVGCADADDAVRRVCVESLGRSAVELTILRAALSIDTSIPWPGND